MTDEVQVALSTEQVKIMFTGTHPQFYRPDQAERAEMFDAWLEAIVDAGVAEGVRQARAAVDRADARFAAHEHGGVILADFYHEVKAALETT